MDASLYGATPGVVSDEAPRCWRCNRQLAILLSRPWLMNCPRCKAQNQGGDAAP